MNKAGLCFGDKVRPVDWTPAPLCVIIEATEYGVEVVFNPTDVGEVGKRFHFVNECVRRETNDA